MDNCGMIMKVFGNQIQKCTYLMDNRTPVQAYKLLSSPSIKPIVFVSFLDHPVVVLSRSRRCGCWMLMDSHHSEIQIKNIIRYIKYIEYMVLLLFLVMKIREHSSITSACFPNLLTPPSHIYILKHAFQSICQPVCPFQLALQLLRRSDYCPSGVIVIIITISYI